MAVSDKPASTRDLSEYLSLAEAAGFSHFAPLAMASLKFRQEVRDMCRADRCHNFGRSWSCPPALGSLDAISRQAARYTRGILLQTTGKTDGDFDLDAIRAAASDHQRHFDTLVRQVRLLSPGALPMGSGGCRRCRKCTYPDRPCRHPGRLYPSMEAYGLLVSEVCLASGLGYNYGPGTITYTACILID